MIIKYFVCSINNLNTHTTVVCRLILLLLFPSLASYANSITYDRDFVSLDFDKQFSNYTVTDIFQDYLGYIWLSTENGLIKYDSYKYSIYYNDIQDETSLSTSQINSVYEDWGKNLWICSKNSVMIYDRYKDNFKHHFFVNDSKNGINISIISISQIDSSSYLVASEYNGLFKFSPKDNKKTQLNLFYEGNGFPLVIKRINSILKYDNNLYWVGTGEKGLFLFDAIENSISYIENSGDCLTQIRDLKMLNGLLYIGTYNNGVWTYDPSTKSLSKLVIPENLDLLSSTFSLFCDTIANNVFIGTDGDGLIVYNAESKKWRQFSPANNNQNSLKTTVVTSIFIDKENNLWIGHFQNGISFSGTKLPFNYINKNNTNSESISKGSVTSILKTSDNYLWLGTDGGGINIMQKDKFGSNYSNVTQKYNALLNPNLNKVLCLTETAIGTVYIGTYLKGLYKYTPSDNSLEFFAGTNHPVNKISNDDIRYLYEDRKGLLWICTNGGGIAIYNPITGTIKNIKKTEKRLKNMFSLNWVVHIMEDSYGYYWISTTYGLVKYDPAKESYTSYIPEKNTPGSISNERIYYTFEDSDRNLWVATAFGLNLYNRKQDNFEIFIDENNGQVSNIIYTITEDNNSCLWLSTDKGLSKFDIRSKEIISYDVNDGLLDKNLSPNAVFKDLDNNLYYGSYEGVTWFHPDSISTAQVNYPIIIRDIKLFNQSVKINKEYSLGIILKSHISQSKEIILSYDENFLSFEFTSLCYRNPNKIQYAYILENLEDKWNYVGNNRIANYTNLPPGKFIFRIKALGDNGKWRENFNSLVVIIKPPFWKTAKAYILFALLFFIIAYFLLKFLYSKTKLKNQLTFEKARAESEHRIDEQKYIFFTNISHEFRTPLTLLSLPLHKLISEGKSLTENSQKHLLQTMKRNVIKLQRLINQVMDIRKIESNNLKLKVVKEDIVFFVKQITLAFDGLAEEKNISLVFNSELTQLITFFDPNKLEAILLNLLSNAFKHISELDTITVSISTKDVDKHHLLPEDNAIDKFILLSVEDTGDGIPKDAISNIFNRFYQVKNDSSGGTGIGLSLVRDLVGIHKGYVNVESELSIGTKFNIFLPYGSESVFADDIVDADLKIEQRIKAIKDENIAYIDVDNEDIVESDDTENTATKPVLLIIEDNSEIRELIKSEFKKDFKVIEAKEGEEGFAACLKHIPDIVLSDIMLPKKDGIEICRDIKENEATNHIPVILVSAKTEDKAKIIGFKTGADDYITKPFNIEILKIKVANLLNRQKNIKEHFKKILIFDSIDVDIPKYDELFLEKSTKIVEDNMKDEDFSVEKFSELIGMSRTQLYRKIFNLTEASVQVFIRTIRIKHAAQLLLKYPDLTISEIAYTVGFKNHSNFNRAFSNQYGKNPSQYLLDAKNTN